MVINNLQSRGRRLGSNVFEYVRQFVPYVDHVVSFNGLTADELIRIVKPDIPVKGGDYSKGNISEAHLVEMLGGKVEVLSYVVNHSTSDVSLDLSNDGSSFIPV